MQYTGKSNEFIQLTKLTSQNCHLLKNPIESSLTILWNMEGKTSLTIDNIEFDLEPHCMVFLTEFHRVVVNKIGLARLIRFNRPFYCISTHDNEVGCKGILFFGASQIPKIKITASEQEKMEILWKMFSIEMQSKDRLQYEMLQMMLKRLIILCTRIYKEQQSIRLPEKGGLDIVREFNYLVETHFKTHHKVADYAAMLNKSPKTLSNLFAEYNHKTPLQIIQERRILEARRLLQYANESISEIAYEMGFEELPSFSRFFKGRTGLSPSKFREKIQERKNR